MVNEIETQNVIVEGNTMDLNEITDVSASVSEENQSKDNYMFLYIIAGISIIAIIVLGAIIIIVVKRRKEQKDEKEKIENK